MRLKGSDPISLKSAQFRTISYNGSNRDGGKLLLSFGATISDIFFKIQNLNQMFFF